MACGNNRRWDLINKQLNSNLTDAEQDELNKLQQESSSKTSWLNKYYTKLVEPSDGFEYASTVSDEQEF